MKTRTHLFIILSCCLCSYLTYKLFTNVPIIHAILACVGFYHIMIIFIKNDTKKFYDRENKEYQKSLNKIKKTNSKKEL